MSFLAIDYGTKHVGLALAQGSLAEPLISIPTTELLSRLPALIQEHQVSQIVIGLPEGKYYQVIKEFGQALAKDLSITVIFHDETLSSVEVGARLQHSPRKKRFGPDHHFAAAVILQDYLDNL